MVIATPVSQRGLVFGRCLIMWRIASRPQVRDPDVVSLIMLTGPADGKAVAGGRYEMRWRSTRGRRRRRRLFASLLILLAALVCYWSLLQACQRTKMATARIPSPAAGEPVGRWLAIAQTGLSKV